MPFSLSMTHLFKPLKVFLQTEDPVWKAWRVMKENEVKLLPVKKNNKIVGLVSSRDIVQLSGHNGGQSMPIKEAMLLNPLIVSVTNTLQEVLKIMVQKEQHHAIVVNDDNEVVGFFSWEIAFEAFLKKNEAEALELKVKGL